MRTYFCFLIPRTDVCARLYKRCALLLFASVLLFGVNLKAQLKCPGALDSIQQVCIEISCDGTIKVSWDGHADKCYSISVANGIISQTNVISRSITFSSSTPGLSNNSKFFINESCGNGINPCSPNPGIPLGIDVITGYLPTLDSVGLWKFANSGSSTNTKDSASVFTASSPSNVPNLANISGLSAKAISIIRPSGLNTTDAKYTIRASFNTGSLDSVHALGDNIVGFLSSGQLSATAGSHDFLINAPGIGAGTHTNQIAAFSGVCRDTITLITTILPGSDEPTMACHASLAISISGDSTVITPAMMLPGQSLANKIAFIDGTNMDSILTCADVGKTVKVVVLDTIFNQKCWGNIIVEDKSVFTASAKDTVIDCLTGLDLILAQNFVTVNDNCTKFSDLQVSFADEFIDFGCGNADTLKVVNRTWILKDPKGNIVNATSKISIVKVPFDTIVFPSDTTVYCPDTILTPQFTGGINLSIDTLAVKCMLMVGFTDRDLPVGCNGMKKIKRSWLAIDWCNNVQKDTVQFITLLDTLPPTITCNADSTKFTNADTCGAFFTIPQVSATDICSDDNLITFDIKVNGVILINQTFGDSVFLPVGSNVIEYIAKDDCGNSASCQDTIRVKDGASPIINGPLAIQIALAGGGNTVVPINLISGAYQITDNCALDSVFIRRLTNDCGVPSDTIFGQSITICCEDTDSVIMVQLLARDTSGNSGVVMISIDVKDAINPVVTCIDTTTIFLDSTGVFVISDSSLFVTNVTDNCLAQSMFQLSRDSFVRADTTAAISLVATIKDLEGNTDTCTTVVIVRDTFTNPAISIITGKVLDPYDLSVPDMKVSLLMEGVEMQQTLSDQDGIFKFNYDSFDPGFGLQFAGRGNQMDGVSSLDLYLIQRHILGTGKLDNVYLELAGDIDRNGIHDVKDLLLLQNAILARENHAELPWLFLNENVSAQELAHVSNDIIPITHNNLSYRAIKMGDVSGDVYTQVDTRSSNSVNLLIEDRGLQKGEHYELPIYLWTTEKIVSFDLRIDISMLDVMDFTPFEGEDLNVVFNMKDGVLKIVGYAEDGYKGKLLIGTLKGKALESQSIREILKVSGSDQKFGKVYNADYDRLELELGWIDASHLIKNNIDILKVYPNPATDKVNFELGLSVDDINTIRIYDILGNEIKDLSHISAPNFSLPTAVFPSSGTYIVNVESAEGRHSEILLINKM